MSRLLTVQDVAERYQLAPRTLYNQRARGVAPGSLGFALSHGIVRWDEADLLEFERSLKASR